jgi:hypothetical protein
MLDAMRKKAGAIGANAILLPQINEPGAGAKVAAAIFGTGTQRKGNVVALRILGRKEPSDSTTAAGPRSTASPPNGRGRRSGPPDRRRSAADPTHGQQGRSVTGTPMRGTAQWILTSGKLALTLGQLSAARL